MNVIIGTANDNLSGAERRDHWYNSPLHQEAVPNRCPRGAVLAMKSLGLSCVKKAILRCTFCRSALSTHGGRWAPPSRLIRVVCAPLSQRRARAHSPHRQGTP